MPAAKKPGSTAAIEWLQSKRCSDALIIIVGLGILLGSTWVSRSQNVFGSEMLLPFVRIVSIFTLVMLAILFRNRSVNEKVLFSVAAGSYALHVVTFFLLGTLVDPSEIISLGIISSLFEGVALALIELLLLLHTLSFSSREIAVVIAAGFLLGNFYDSLFVNASVDIIVIQWLVGKLGALALLAIPVLRTSPQRSASATEDLGKPAVGSRDDMPELGMSKYIPFALFVFVLMLIQGFIAQMTGLGGVGASAFYGTAVAIVILGVRILTLVFCAVREKDLDIPCVTAICATAFASALLLIYLFWDKSAEMPGALAMEAGYCVLQVLPLVVAAQYARKHPSAAVFSLGIMAALIFSNQFTRLLGSYLVDTSALGVSELASVSFVSLWLVVFVLIVLYLGAAWRSNSFEQATQASLAFPEDGSLSNDCQNDPLVQREVEFSRRFKKVCDDKHLTLREQEVLFEAVHGYTIDTIADKMCLSRDTVKTHLSKSYSRAGVNSKQAFLHLVDTCGMD